MDFPDYPTKSNLKAYDFFKFMLTDPTKLDIKQGLEQLEYITFVTTDEVEADVAYKDKYIGDDKLEDLKRSLQVIKDSEEIYKQFILNIKLGKRYITSEVDEIIVENDLTSEQCDELINYIDVRLKGRSLFRKRINLKPLEYPELIPHADAINQSYWLFTEYNYTGDIQNFKVDLNDFERNVITKAMLGISQIEVGVKRFWGDLYWYFQKPEVDIVGSTFSDSEARHLRAYSELLNLLGMDSIFERLPEFEPLMKRVEYTENFLRNRKDNNVESVLSLMLFSMFIEHISLFSQFLVIQSFNKERNWFKGISNAISATVLEEEIHGNFGVALYNILRTEEPHLFTNEMYEKLHQLADQAFEAEMGIVDWMYEGGDLEFMTKEETKNYIKYRFNRSYKALGFEPKYVVDTDMLEKVRWFEVELSATKENDFFNKRSTDYTKNTKEFSADSLFD